MRQKTFILSILALALLLPSCAQKETEASNKAAKRYFDAYLTVYFPHATKVKYGTYVNPDDEIKGSGESVDDYPYIFASYTKRSLDGTISSTTSDTIAKQVGTYAIANYYGSEGLKKSNLYAGIEEGISGMKVGGARRMIIPTWMMTYSRYDSEQYYLDNVTDVESCILDVQVTGVTDDITKWEIDTLERYIARHFPEEKYGKVDSLFKGFYMVKLRAASDTTKWASDTTFNVNYTGKLLSDKAFDTTIKDTAKVHHIYSSSTTYSTQSVVWSSTASSITLGGSSSLIKGMTQALYRMRRGEKVVALFISDYGYGSSGSSTVIPSYAPLAFEIEMVSE